MTKAISSDEALEIAKKWLLNDPDEITRSETQNLISESGDEIIRRFGGSLLFGTAGIRGPRGAGPMRMNRLMVRVVASAIAKKLLEDTQNDEVPLVVVGYDARHQSQVFAEDSARVLATHGIKCLILPEPLPTPVLAYTLLSQRATAGIMVTASHNPAEDSGYKVYWEDGAQITTPIDTQIAEKIDYINPPLDTDLADLDDPLITKGGSGLVEKYVDRLGGADDGRNIKWTIDKLRFDNAFSYGKDNYINFKSLPGITGIFGRNARGKSSIIGTIAYSLFNTSDRGSIKNLHLINTRYNSCKAEIDITINGIPHRIVRQTIKKVTRKNIWAPTTLKFYRLNICFFLNNF